MAVRSVTVVEGGNGTQIATWADLDGSASDTGKPVALAGWPDKTIQIIGGTSCSIEGSNDGGTTWNAMNDLSGPLTAKAAGLYVPKENPALIRVNTVVGDNLSVIIVAIR